MAADDLQLHGTLKGSSGKNLLMKKKRKIHIHAEKNAHRKKYSTETISLIGLAIVAILNVHLHFNVSIVTICKHYFPGQILYKLMTKIVAPFYWDSQKKYWKIKKIVPKLSN